MLKLDLLADMTAGIVVAYVANNHVTPTAMPALIATVRDALSSLEKPAEPTVKRPDARAIAQSITPDRIISFEDGKPYKALRRHLTIRGLTPEAYKAKWGLPIDYPLVAASYSARRSKISKEVRMGWRRAADMVPTPE